MFGTFLVSSFLLFNSNFSDLKAAGYSDLSSGGAYKNSASSSFNLSGVNENSSYIEVSRALKENCRKIFGGGSECEKAGTAYNFMLNNLSEIDDDNLQISVSNLLNLYNNSKDLLNVCSVKTEGSVSKAENSNKCQSMASNEIINVFGGDNSNKNYLSEDECQKLISNSSWSGKAFDQYIQYRYARKNYFDATRKEDVVPELELTPVAIDGSTKMFDRFISLFKIGGIAGIVARVDRLEWEMQTCMKFTNVDDFRDYIFSIVGDMMHKGSKYSKLTTDCYNKECWKNN